MISSSIQNYKFAEKSLYIYENVPDHLQIKKNNFGYGLYSNKKINKGESIVKQGFIIFQEELIDKIFLISNNNEYEINKHIHGDYNNMNDKKMWIGTYTCFLNHSCDPNITYQSLNDEYLTDYVAIKDIEEGEELTMNYNSFIAEWTEPLKCQCNSHSCMKEIKGYKFLDEIEREKINKTLINFDIEELQKSCE